MLYSRARPPRGAQGRRRGDRLPGRRRLTVVMIAVVIIAVVIIAVAIIAVVIIAVVIIAVVIIAVVIIAVVITGPQRSPRLVVGMR